jgi:Na+:H+ antiporter, NhaA family
MAFPSPACSTGLQAALETAATGRRCLGADDPTRLALGRPDDPHSLLHTFEHTIHPWVGFGVVPVFGFANAGVSFAGLDTSALVGPVPLGIALGLIVGKQISVFGTAWATVRLGYADKPDGATMPQLHGVALLCGIGFTMSLFIGGLAVAGSPELSDAVKIGVLGGSIISGVAGWTVFRLLPETKVLKAAE